MHKLGKWLLCWKNHRRRQEARDYLPELEDEVSEAFFILRGSVMVMKPGEECETEREVLQGTDGALIWVGMEP